MLEYRFYSELCLLEFVSSINENGCNIPLIKEATLDKPSEMMAFSLSDRELG
jgi:hypothetical protein